MSQSFVIETFDIGNKKSKQDGDLTTVLVNHTVFTFFNLICVVIYDVTSLFVEQAYIKTLKLFPFQLY